MPFVMAFSERESSCLVHAALRVLYGFRASGFDYNYGYFAASFLFFS